MALTTEQRKEVSKNFQRHESNNRSKIACTTVELQAAVDSIDDSIDAAFILVNSNIPQPAKTALTKKQKLKIFLDEIYKRMEVE